MAGINKRTVATFLEAAANNEVVDFSSVFHEDLMVVEADSLPYAGVHRGADGFKALVSQVFKTWSNTRVTTERLLEDEDYVIVLAEMKGASRESGQPFRMPIVELWRFENGKAIEIRPFYFDTKAMHDLYRGKA